MGKLLDKAITFATSVHTGQLRKGTDIPYILHPLEAAAIVGTMTTDDEIIAGAVLHDVVEDTNSTIEQVRELFGEQVAELVASESEDKRETLSAPSTWKIRKQETLDHLKTAPVDVKMITLGDKLSNIRAIYRDYNSIGDALWNRFNQKDKNEHYWYYQSIADCLTELKDYQVYKEYCKLVRETFTGKDRTTEDKMLSIEKLEYRRCYFDVSTMQRGAKITTIITNDGAIISKEYKAGSRKVSSFQKTSCSLEEFEKLCDEIELCIKNADRLDFYDDDASEELIIFYKYGRVQKMDRGFGDEDSYIGDIVNNFLEKHLSVE